MMSKLKFKECENCRDWNGNRGHCADICSKPYDAMDGFNRYMELEEQGLLIKLPCKCDEVVWSAEKGFLPHKALYSCQSAMLEDIEHGIGIGYTKEEAESALKEMG